MKTMKNLKLFGIIMMLVMGMSFTSCSDDDSNGVSPETINELLEGEWFLVKAEDSEGTSISWDFENQTKYGKDANGKEQSPVKLYIEKYSDSESKFLATNYTYSNYSGWEQSSTQTFNLNGNILSEESGTESGISYHSKTYISSLTESTLVVVTETSASYQGASYSVKMIQSYRRND